MAEYIDREKLLRDIEHYHLSDGKFQHWVEIQLAADVAPVRHGRWKCHGDCGVTECSACGWSIEEYVGDYAYCPNCGAKMDGSSNEE